MGTKEKEIIYHKKKNKNRFPFSWAVSLLAHGLLLALPVSLVVKAQYPELEFFVLPKPPVEQEKALKVKPPLRPPLSPKVHEPPAPEKEKESPPKNTIELMASNESPVEMSAPALPLPPPMHQEGSPAVSGALSQPERPKEPVEAAFGEGDGPRFLHRVDPVYPPLARRWGKEGKVVLRLHLNEKGDLLQVEVVVGQGFGLTEAAVQAVKNSSFLPAHVKGKPVACKALLPIVFILRRE